MKNHINAANAASITAATKKNVTPTFAELCQKPFLACFSIVAMVVAAAGGAVGVTVRVLTSPVTVMTDM